MLSNPHGTETGTTNYSTCGASFCASVSNTDSESSVDSSELYEIMSIYLGCIVVAVLLIVALVDPLSR